MNYLSLETEILSSVKHLNGLQKSSVLAYIRNIESAAYTKRYRRKAMKEIREALKGV